MEIRPRVLKCCILGGKFAGTSVFIPRITLKPSDQSLPLPFSRHQFPVRLAFAMTVNKSQGQSVKHVGLDLRVPVFSHGQLYVALSRCTSKDHIKVLLPAEANKRTPNIVYQEILNGIVNGMWSNILIQLHTLTIIRLTDTPLLSSRHFLPDLHSSTMLCYVILCILFYLHLNVLNLNLVKHNAYMG